jgi:hypothetical protein
MIQKIKLFHSKFVKLRKANNRLLKFFVSVYSVVAGVWILFKDSKSLTNETKSLFEIFKEDPSAILRFSNMDILVYWLIFASWIILYFFYISDESATNKERTESLKSAILRSANPKIFTIYLSRCETIRTTLAAIDGSHQSYVKAFKDSLGVICKLISEFRNIVEPDIIFGANIMIYIPTNTNLSVVEKLLTKDAINSKEWFHFTEVRPDATEGVLRLIPDLVVANKMPGTSKERVIPTITIPVISDKVLPGAPKAIFAGNCVFSDVRNPSDYKHLGDTEVHNAIQYWEKQAPEILSVFSIRISDDRGSIIGVLNIDSTKRDILGNEDEYHLTYAALMFSICCIISPFLVEYVKKFYSNVDKRLQDS